MARATAVSSAMSFRPASGTSGTRPRIVSSAGSYQILLAHCPNHPLRGHSAMGARRYSRQMPTRTPTKAIPIAGKISTHATSVTAWYANNVRRYRAIMRWQPASREAKSVRKPCRQRKYQRGQKCDRSGGAAPIETYSSRGQPALSFAEYHHMINAFPADRTDHRPAYPFGMGSEEGPADRDCLLIEIFG